jgi:hypothetical protein
MLQMSTTCQRTTLYWLVLIVNKNITFTEIQECKKREFDISLMEVFVATSYILQRITD